MRCTRFGPFGLLLSRGGRVLLLVAGLLLGGCSFIGHQYTNFTAYYNKFYNANEAFEDARESITEEDGPVDRTRYLSIFLKPGRRGNNSAFEKTIQKSADVLREHPDSKWVDDALLLIGKSYFYQQNYVGAVQKFREVMALKTGRTKEARFWLARTLVATERDSEAEDVLRAGLQNSGLDPWTARFHLVRGQLLVRREQWQEAAAALNRGLEGDVPERVGARGAFLLGQVHETMGNAAAARAAYQEVQSFDPRYPLAFAARLNDIELQGKHGNTSEALDRLHDLERDDKNYEQRGEMTVVRARIYRAEGRHDQARRTLRNTLYGEEPPSGTAKGRLHYDLARLYRDAYRDFSQAAAHFDTASTSLRQRARPRDREEVQRMPAAPVDPRSQAARFENLADRARDVARMDSLLRVGRMSDEDFRAFVQKLRSQRQAEQEAQQEARARMEQSLRLRGGGQTLAERRQQAAPAADTRESDAGFLFYDDPARVQQGQRQFEQTWGDRPRVDNWRRRDAIGTSQSASTTAERSDQEQPSPVGADATTGPRSSEPAALDLSGIPRDSASQAKMEAERAVARYKLGNSLFLAAGRPDSAATWYRRVLQENGDQPVARRALYALAEAYRAQGDSTAAQEAYRRLIDQYPDTDLATRARQRLGRRERMPANNRGAIADTAYAKAYKDWQRGRVDAALPRLLRVAAQYPETDAAPRALLAAGIIYWKQGQRDSTAGARVVLKRHLRALRDPDSMETPQRRPAPDTVQDSTRISSAASRGAATDSTGGTPNARQDWSPAQISGDTLRAPTGDRGGRSSRPRSSQRQLAARDSTGRVARDTAPDSSRETRSPRAQMNGLGLLESLLTLLTDRYPDAPQAKQARSLLSLIEDQRTETDSVLADSTTRRPAGSDTTISPGPATARRQDGQQPAPGAAVESDTTSSTSPGQRTEPSENEEALPAPKGVMDRSGRTSSEGGVDPSRGGWTLLVDTLRQSDEVPKRVADLARAVGDRWPVDTLKEARNSKAPYRLVVGQFESRGAAARAGARLANQLSSRPEVWALSEAKARP